MTYEVRVARTFVAQHALTVPDAGPEGERHSHQYEADVLLAGESLNEHGYLLDIDDATAALDDVVDRYRDEMLNEQPEFEGDNPSLERFARAICDRFLDRVDADRLDAATVRLWEDDDTWAAYQQAT